MKYRIVILSDASVGSIQSTIKSILTEFFPDAKTFDGRDIPPPVIKIVDRLSAKWLGRCIFRRSKSHTTVIELQRSILSDAKTLDRVLCHVDSSPGKIDVRPGTLGEVFEDVNGLCVQVDEYYMYYDSPEEAAEFWAVTK